MAEVDKQISLVLDPKWDCAVPVPVRFRYVVFSQQRTGSTWLQAVLSNSGRLGMPAEYLNIRYCGKMAQRLLGSSLGEDAVGVREYMAAVERVRTSPNGVFGIKLQPNQLFRMVGADIGKAIEFLQRFDAVVCLARHDKLGQAISGAKASALNKWHNDGQAADLSGLREDSFNRLVASQLARYLDEAEKMRMIRQALGAKAMELSYEDLLAQGSGAFCRIFDFLGEPFDERFLAPDRKVRFAERAPVEQDLQLKQSFLDFIQGRAQPVRSQLYSTTAGVAA